MGSIRVLDSALVDQIAAGEVVERPSSVVKELLDNALDAGATSVRVEISEGGRERIRVSDDGAGMDPEDAALCVRRHATSKIARFEDFRRLRTMGFRGEALASIASVSRFRLTTRPRASVAGTEVVVEGGGEPRVREVGAPPGTTVDVQDLFFNVPARRKFLKARQTESHHVAEACLRAALAFPSLRLVLTSNGRRVREYLPASDRTTRARAVFADQALTSIEGRHDGVEVLAALGPPSRARSGARHLYLFVNDRPVVDRGLARAVAFAYGDALELGRYPAGAVFLTLPLDEVDVNAHPQKTEVRFAKARRVYDAVTRVVAKALGTRSWGGGIHGSVSSPAVGPAGRGAAFWDARLKPGPTLDRGARSAAARPRPDAPTLDQPRAASPQPPAETGPAQGARPDRTPPDRWGLAAALGGRDTEALGDRDAEALPDRDMEALPDRDTEALREAAPSYGAADHTPPAPGEEPSSAPASTPQASAPRLLAILGEAWLALWDGALLVLDPRRAARALTLAHWSAQVPTRRLLFPARVEVTAAEASLTETHRQPLAALGLDLSLVGPRTVAVHTLPEPHPSLALPEPSAERVLAAAFDAVRTDSADLAGARATLAGALVTSVDPSCAPALLDALARLPASTRGEVTARWTAGELLGRLR